MAGATGVVTATGMDTELGAHCRHAGSASEGVETPLQRRMADLGKKLALLCTGGMRGGVWGGRAWRDGTPHTRCS